jgi:hypothetical protein
VFDCFKGNSPKSSVSRFPPATIGDLLERHALHPRQTPSTFSVMDHGFGCELSPEPSIVSLITGPVAKKLAKRADLDLTHALSR